MDTTNQEQFLEAAHLEPLVDRLAYEENISVEELK